jgi:hypothetical protein
MKQNDTIYDAMSHFVKTHKQKQKCDTMHIDCV